ncbi:MAG: protein TolR, partial [Pseudomonadaceae bacterium]|nr:protein TolR [Pseudomonadaceae bacterium]
GVDVELPQVTSQPINNDAEQEPLVISLDAEGLYYLEMGADSKDPMELSVIIKQVAALKRQNPQLPVLVRGDRRVSYGEVVVLMGELQGAGVTQVGLISKPVED